MGKFILAAVISLAMAFTLGFAGDVIAGNTTACPNPPTGLTCVINATDNIIEADWTLVNCGDGNPAEKYSVSVEAGYDTDGDGISDTYVEFDFGTSDRTDGDPISESDLDIPIEGLDIDVDGDGVIDSPIEAELKVKGLSHYAKKLKQNNAWSNSCTVDLN
ncbi:MAG: hypothetical protein L0922_07325 [Candidatus Mariimomonas ferrooxydans]